MTTYSIVADANWFDLPGKAGGDGYNIDRTCTLTLDGDTRYGPNTTTTTGPVGIISGAYTCEATISIDASNVRLIPFNNGSGVVPPADTLIVQGGVTGKLLGVWSAINVAPIAVGAAMPASGFMKVRQKAGGYFQPGMLEQYTSFFTNVVGCTVNGNTLTKNAVGVVWDAGASSYQALMGDGYIEFKSCGHNTLAILCGLSEYDADTNYDTVVYAFTCNNSVVGLGGVFELGISQQAPQIAIAPGDTYRIQRTGTTITYYRNGVLVYTSGRASSKPLVFDCSFAYQYSQVTVTAFVGATSLPAVGAPFWRNIVGCVVNGTTIQKNNPAYAWSAGASSYQVIQGDGYVAYTAPAVGSESMLGLSLVDLNAGMASIDYAIYLDALGRVYVYESNVAKNPAPAVTYVAGDTFRVNRTGTTITYLKNGAVFYTSLTASSGPLVVDCSIAHEGLALTNVTLSGATPYVLPYTTFFQNVVGCSAVNGTTILKTAAGGAYDAGARSAQRITGDGSCSFTISGTSTIAGLSTADPNATEVNLGYGLLYVAGTYRVYESNVYKTEVAGAVVGDQLMISRTGDTITYWHKGVAFYTSAAKTTLPLMFDCSINVQGRTIGPVTFVGATVAQGSFWQDVVGAVEYSKGTGVSLTRSIAGSAWTSKGLSVQRMFGDCTADFVVTAGMNTMAGLCAVDSLPGYQDINYAFQVVSGNANQYALGTNLGAATVVVAGDVLSIRRSGTTVRGYKNGGLVCTWPVASTGSLGFKAAMYNSGDFVSGVVLTGATPTFSACAHPFQNVVGCAIAGNNITKTTNTSAWDSGASSVQRIEGDGYLEFSIGELIGSRAVGLSYADKDFNFSSVNFCIAPNGYINGKIDIIENGAQKTASTTTLIANSRLRVQRDGTVITYWQDGVLIYTSLVASTGALVLDCALYWPYYTVKDIVLSGATGVDIPGWIEVVGQNASYFSIPQLGTFKTRGDWFYLGTTSGVRGQTFALPTSGGTTFYVPGVFIETAVGSGVFRPWPCLTALTNGGWVNTQRGTDARSPYVQCDGSLIRIGSDGANNIGLLPAAGLRVMLPNVVLQNCTSAARGVTILPDAALGNRYDSSGAQYTGVYDIEKCSTCWYVVTAPTAFRMVDSAWADAVNFVFSRDSIYISNCAGGVTNPSTTALTLGFSLCSGTALVEDCAMVMAYASANTNTYPLYLNVSDNITLRRCWVDFAIMRVAAMGYGAGLASDCTNVTFEDCTFGQQMHVRASTNVSFYRHTYFDCPIGTTAATFGMCAVYFYLQCSDVLVDGLSWIAGVANVHPYLYSVNLNGCTRAIVRNIGTPAARIELGSANACAAVAACVGGCAGVLVQRVYAQNTRTAAVIVTYSDTLVVCDNCWGDAADVSNFLASAGLYRGAYWGGAVPGTSQVAKGFHWWDAFTSATGGRIGVTCYPPVPATADQVTLVGDSFFDGVGDACIPTIDSSITWECPYFVLGITSWGTSLTFSVNSGSNFAYEYQTDVTGTGYGVPGLLTNVVNARWSGTSITKTSASASYNAGASSAASIAGDGYVEFTVGAGAHEALGGLTTSKYTVSYTGTSYGIACGGGVGMLVYELGSSVYNAGGVTVTGDVFRVQRIGTEITYWKNGVKKYTSLVASTGPLYFDCSLYTPAGSFTNITLSGAAYVIPFYDNISAGLVAVGNILTKRVADGWTTGASSRDRMPGDGYVEYTMPADNGISLLFGLAYHDWDGGFNNTPYMLSLCNAGPGTVTIMEMGVDPLGGLSVWNTVPGDVVRVQRIGTVVTYWHNGVLLYTSTVAATTAPMMLDVSIYHNGKSSGSVALSGFVTNDWKTLGVGNTARESVDPALGVRTKFRLRCIRSAGVNTNYATAIHWQTLTDAVSQQIQYPLTNELSSVYGAQPQLPAGTLYQEQLLSSSTAQDQLPAGTLTTAQVLSSLLAQAQLSSGALTVAQVLSSLVEQAQLPEGTLTVVQALSSLLEQAQLPSGALSVAQVLASLLEQAQHAEGSITVAQVLSSLLEQVQEPSGSLYLEQVLSSLLEQEQLPIGNFTTGQYLNASMAQPQLPKGTLTGSIPTARSAVTWVPGDSPREASRLYVGMHATIKVRYYDDAGICVAVDDPALFITLPDRSSAMAIPRNELQWLSTGYKHEYLALLPGRYHYTWTGTVSGRLATGTGEFLVHEVPT